MMNSTGGYATAEWLEENLSSYLDKSWNGGDSPEEAVTDAFLKVCAQAYPRSSGRGVELV